MAGRRCRSSAVGAAADDHPLPPPPTDGRRLPAAWAPRSTTSTRRLGPAATPSSSCSSARRSPASGRARAAPACRTSGPGSPPGPASCPSPFTARPGARQITLAEAAADTYVDAFRRTPLHDEHLALGARMDRFGGWWRPWHYGDVGRASTGRSARASRSATSRTLGKLVVCGPGRRRGPRADLPVPRRGHQARPLALRAAAQRARPRHGRRDDPPRGGDAVRADVHVRRRGQRRDVAPRLGRHVGPPRPRHGPDDVPRRDQRHGAARRGAAASGSAWRTRRGSSATSTPRSPASRAT